MRTLENRLRKLEAAAAPPLSPDTPSFWVFGRDQSDIDQRLAAEIGAGRLQNAEMAFPVIWRGAEPLPAARWAKAGALTEDESDDWYATLVQMTGGEPHPRGDEGSVENMIAAIAALRALAPAHTT